MYTRRSLILAYVAVLALGLIAGSAVTAFLCSAREGSVPHVPGASEPPGRADRTLAALARIEFDWMAGCDWSGRLTEVRRAARRPWIAGALDIDGRSELRTVARHVVLDRLRRASVVVVADDHTLPGVQRAFARLLYEVRASGPIQQGRLAIACEALAVDRQRAVGEIDATARATAVRDLVRELRDSWPWPIAGYASWAEELPAAVSVFLPAGLNRAVRASEQPSEDALRAPTEYYPEDWVETGRWLTEPNDNAITSVTRFLANDSLGSQVWVLIGSDHILHPQLGLLPRLAALGYDVVVVAPFDVGWELAAYRRFDEDAETAVLEVLPDVYRVPVLGFVDILECARVAALQRGLR